ncbi:MAG: tetratricopeptide repeat protein [Myxococcota bacterium]
MPAFVAAEWSGPRRLAAAATGAVCVAAFAVVSVQQVRHWRDTAALFEHAIAVTAENAHAQAILGAAYQRQGRLEEASVHLSEAVRLRPAWAKPRVRLADVEAARQRWAEAVPHYEQALRSQPRHARARINLAQALIRLGRFELARRQLERVLTAGRHVSAVYRLSLHRGLARTAWERGEPGEAIEHYRLALEVRPNDAVAHAGLGLTLARTGRGDEARAHLTAIPGDWPANSAEVRAARVAAAVTSGVALPEESPPREQRSDFRYVDDHRAWILATSANPAVRDPDEAIALMEQALREGVANPLRLDTLAAGYAAAGRFPDAIRAATRAERAAAEPALARQIRARLALYRARTAYLETPPDG